MSRLVRQTLAEQARDALFAELLAGSLKPRTRLLPVELAERLGISATPMKEALIILEAQGLVSAPTRRGTSVRVFTSRDLDELFEVRALIEQNALSKLLARKLPPEELARALSIPAQEGVAQIESDGQTVPPWMLFSRQLVNLAGNSLVRRMHVQAIDQIRVAIAPETLDRTNQISQLHSAILNDDPVAAREALCQELEDQLAAVRELVNAAQAR